MNCKKGQSINKYKSNSFWDDINTNIVNSKTLDNDFDNFRKSKINYKLSTFNPEKNGVRYLKTLLYNLAQNLSANEFDDIASIKNRNTGNPFCTIYSNEKIDLDYLMAIYEISFIKNKISLEGGGSILEIGGGYGRTAHAILSTSNINKYTIVDLKDTITVSKKYLSHVLTENQFKKVHFITTDEIPKYKFANYDLAININSFAEMDKDVVLSYLGLIDEKANYFYTKNPIGKYLDVSLDNHSQGTEVVKQALSIGLLTDIVNIDDNIDIHSNVPKFIQAYTPSKKWRDISNSWAKPFSYYWQTLYEKNI